MGWVAVDKDGTECVYYNKPIKYNYDKYKGRYNDLYYPCYNIMEDKYCEIDTKIPLPKGSIKKLIGRDLDWNDEPVELKEE